MNAAQQLAELREAYTSGLAQSTTVAGIIERRTVKEQILNLERKVASEAGQEYALEWQWPVPAAFGQELVFCRGHQTFLVYPAIQQKSPGEFAKLEFSKCAATKYGSPNDEAIEGHPLFGRGLEAGGAYIVQNSQWLAELEAMNRVHPQHSADAWQKLRHYVLFFKDRAFECVASEEGPTTTVGGLSSLLLNVPCLNVS